MPGLMQKGNVSGPTLTSSTCTAATETSPEGVFDLTRAAHLLCWWCLAELLCVGGLHQIQGYHLHPHDPYEGVSAGRSRIVTLSMSIVCSTLPPPPPPPTHRSGVGVTGSKQTMFYAEVSDDNRVGAGGGEPREGELIEVVKVPLHEAMTFAYDERIPKTMGVIFSFIWFHNNMSPKYKISTNV